MNSKLLSGLWGLAVIGLLAFSFCSNADELPEAGAQRIPRFDEFGSPIHPGLHQFNIQTSPVGLAFSRYNASIEVGVTKSLALGLKGTNFPHSAPSEAFDTITGYEVGGRATWYATSDRFTDGFIVRGGAFYKNTETHNDLADALGNAMVKVFTLGLGSSTGTIVDVTQGPAFELMGGYQIVLASGLNCDFNAGLNTYQQYSKVVNLTDGSSEIYESKAWHFSPVLEFNIGYAF